MSKNSKESKDEWKMSSTYFNENISPRLPGSVPTMFEVPWADSKEKLLRNDFVFLGIPWEGTGYSNGKLVQRKYENPDPKSIGGRSGYQLAPKHIREHSVWLSLRATGGLMPEYGKDFEMLKSISIADYGDVAVSPENLKKTIDDSLEKVGDIVDAKAIPLVIGGDHSIPAMVLPAISERKKTKTGIIWFDAHYDLHWGEMPLTEASALHQIYTKTQNKPENLAIIGIQGTQNLPNWHRAAEAIGATTFTTMDIEEKGIEQVIRESIKVAMKDCDEVYISMDADAFAYHEFTATAAPQGPFGLTMQQMRKALRIIAQECPIAGVDIACVAPPYDTKGASAVAVAYLFLEILAQKALSKSRRK